MSDYRGIFVLIPAWGNDTFGLEHYAVYLISDNKWFGHQVGQSCESVEAAINKFNLLSKKLIQKYPTKQSYFDSLKFWNSNTGMVVPKALKEYVKNTLMEYGDPHRDVIDEIVYRNRYVSIKSNIKFRANSGSGAAEIKLNTKPRFTFRPG